MRDLMEQFGWTEPLIPMNAKDPKDKLESLFKDDNYVAELKYDGSRYICIGTPEGGRFFSRKKSENKKSPETLGMPVEKTLNLPHLSEAFRGKNFIVDGEIVYFGKKSNDVTKIMGATPEKAQARQSQEYGWVEYVIFDVLYNDGLDIRGFSWEYRRGVLEELYKENFEDHLHIYLSEVYYGEEDKRDLLGYAEETGEEGIMLKNRNATYQSDKRPEHHWYKVKGEITIDVVVMGYEPPEQYYTGKDVDTWTYWEHSEDGSIIETTKENLPKGYGWNPVTRYHAEGWIGSVLFGLYKDGKLVEAGRTSGMTDEVRKEFSDHQEKFIGQVIEIKAMERTKDGKFRHPRFLRFRDDKNAEDCLWEVEAED